MVYFKYFIYIAKRLINVPLFYTAIEYIGLKWSYRSQERLLINNINQKEH